MKNTHASDNSKSTQKPAKPLLIDGLMTILDSDGNVQDETAAYCRCGKSADMPYCDGGHRHRTTEG